MRAPSDTGAASARAGPPEVLPPLNHPDSPLAHASSALAGPAADHPPGDEAPGGVKPMPPWLRALLRALAAWPI